MAVTATLIASGQSALASTVVSFSAQTAGTQLVLIAVGDDYSTGTPSGFTQLWSVGTGSGAFHGNTAWRKTAVGSETSVTYVIGSASKSVYALVALANVDTTTPVDVAGASQFQNSSLSTYTTPTSGTSTAGSRYALAAIGGSSSGGVFTSVGTWLNSYSAIGTALTTATPGEGLGVAGLNFAGGGTTSSGATFAVTTPQSRSGGIVVFREASGGATNYNGTASLAASDAVSSAGVVGAAIGASVAGTDTVTTAGSVGRSAGSSVAATDTVAAAGATGTRATATVSATGAITCAGSVSAAGGSGATLAATGVVTAGGVVAGTRPATLTATDAVTGAGSVGASTGTSSVSVVTVTTTGQVGKATAASVAGVATISADGTVIAGGGTSGTVAGVATISAAGQVGKTAGATLTTVGAIAANGVGPTPTTRNITATAALIPRPYTGHNQPRPDGTPNNNRPTAITTPRRWDRTR